MNTLDFLSYLRGLDINLSADGERLHVNAPKGVLTPSVQAEISARKAEILTFLQETNFAASSPLPSIPIVSRDADLPLSDAQERLWSVAQLAPDSAVYNLHIAVRLTGSLNVPALERSLSEIVRRHETLRTTFSVVEEKPVQVISSDLKIKLPVVDLKQLAGEKLEVEVQRRAEEEAKTPFDLEQDLLLRVGLLRLDESEYIFLATMHHMISDGWSFKVFFQELSALYKAFSDGKSSPIPALPVQYADFAAWHRQWLQGEKLEAQRGYWKQQLSGEVPVLDLPADYPRSAAKTDRGASQSLVLSKALTEKLKIFTRHEERTLFITLLAAFKALLYQYTGQEDLVICSPVACRDHDQTKGLIGYFNNIVVMRTNLSDDPNFRTLMDRVQQVALATYEHQDFPFQELTEFPNLVRVPLSRAMFTLQSPFDQFLELPETSASALVVHNGRSTFDLSLTIEERPETLMAVLTYKTDLFNATTIIEMAANFQTLLESIVANPDQQLSTLPHLQSSAESSRHSQVRLRDDSALEDLAGEQKQENSQSELENTSITDRMSLEYQLIKIWQQVLNLRAVGPTDNFFDLGGHSLLAVRLFDQIERALCRKIPPTILLQAPTIKQLADRLCEEGWLPNLDTLIPIQPEGSRRPFFFVAAPNVNTIGYTFLARHLDTNQPVYVLQSQSHEEMKEPLYQGEVEALATEYIEAMRAVHPHGPYLLGGMCYGAYLVLEMAKQLRAQEQEVALLAIIDTWADPYLFNPYFWYLRRATAPLRWYAGRLKVLFQLSFAEQLGLVRAIAAKKAKGKTQRDDGPGRELPQPSRIHSPQGDYRWPGRITLFRLRRQPYYRPRDHECGWGERAEGGVEVHILPAKDHFTMLREPHVQALAEPLKACLDKVQPKDSTQS